MNMYIFFYIVIISIISFSFTKTIVIKYPISNAIALLLVCLIPQPTCCWKWVQSQMGTMSTLLLADEKIKTGTNQNLIRDFWILRYRGRKTLSEVE